MRDIIRVILDAIGVASNDCRYSTGSALELLLLLRMLCSLPVFIWFSIFERVEVVAVGIGVVIVVGVLDRFSFYSKEGIPMGRFFVIRFHSCCDLMVEAMFVMGVDGAELTILFHLARDASSMVSLMGTIFRVILDVIGVASNGYIYSTRTALELLLLLVVRCSLLILCWFSIFERVGVVSVGIGVIIFVGFLN